MEIIAPQEKYENSFLKSILTSVPSAAVMGSHSNLSSCVKGNNGKMAAYAEVVQSIGPLFVSSDDTVLLKTVPSSKKRPTEVAGWHYSHLERKVVYEYQVHAAIVGTGNISLCNSLKHCCSENGLKIDLTVDAI